ncbi:MAG: flagellar hook-associated protein FlgL [Deltaproteobacteria bacterium]|nr:flagellar hook-associated protein FlgL [Deltaproteobacteria bacterium]
MSFRVTETMKFQGMVDNLFRVQRDYTKLMEQMTTQKTINRPSDDPLGMTRVAACRSSLTSIEQYKRNINTARSWITMTESKLTAIDDLIVKARETAVAGASATASADSRQTGAVAVGQLTDELLSLANGVFGDRYLFAGTKVDEAPFSADYAGPTIGDPKAAGGNAFDGSLSASGTYSGATNKTLVVKIVAGGDLGEAAYQLSGDGGRTWSAVYDDLESGTITLGDGINLTFVDDGSEHLAIGDVFMVEARAPGYYRGNGEELTLDINRETGSAYSLTGEDVFTAHGAEGVDIFETFHNLRQALEENDQGGIEEALEDLKKASAQISRAETLCGTKINRLDIAESNLTALEGKLTEMISATEDVDLTELITQFSMKETVLQASYAMISKIESASILEFLK